MYIINQDFNFLMQINQKTKEYKQCFIRQHNFDKNY